MLSEPINTNMENIKYKVRKTVTKGDITKELVVEEVENGFIICIEESGHKGEGEKKEYYCDEKKYISKTNPLDDKEDKSAKEVSTSIIDVINALNI